MKSLRSILLVLGLLALASCDRSANIAPAETPYATLTPRVQSRAGTAVGTADSVLITVVAGDRLIDTVYPYAAHRGMVNHVPVGAVYALTVRGFNSVNATSSSEVADTATKRVTVWAGTHSGTASLVVDSASAASNAPVVTVDTAVPLALGLKDTAKQLASTGAVAIPVVGTDTARVLRYAIDAEPTASSPLVPSAGTIPVARTCRVVVRTFQRISGVWVGASVPETLTVHVAPASPKLVLVADSAGASVTASWTSVDSAAKYLFYMAPDSVSASELALTSHRKGAVLTSTKTTVPGLSRGRRYTFGVRAVWGPDSLLRDTGAVASGVVGIPQDSTISVTMTRPGSDTVVAYAQENIGVIATVVSALHIDSVLVSGQKLVRQTDTTQWTGTVSGLVVGDNALKAVAYAKGKTGAATRKVTRQAVVVTAKPVIERISPTRDSTMLYTGQATYNVQVRVNDSNAVSQVTVGTFPASYDAASRVWSAKATLLHGWNTFAVEALDAVGNLGLDTVRIFVDQVKPRLKLISPSYDTTIYDTNRTVFRVEVEATDSMGVASVTIGGVPAVKLAGTTHWVATTPATNDTVRICVKDSSGNDTDRVLGIWHHYFIDSRDGQKYNYVKIGTQTWMAQNLNYRDTGKGSQDTIGVCYNNIDSNCTTYGRLYKWVEVMAGRDSSSQIPSGVQGICPSGWHVPSYGEWNKLINYVDQMTSGTKLKSILGWSSGMDVYGFRALPSGMIDGGLFSRIGYNTGLWSTSVGDGHGVWYLRFQDDWAYTILPNDESIYFGRNQGLMAFSLRCIRNN